MSKALSHLRKLDRPRFSTPMLDKYAIVPIAACVFALIVSPLLIFYTPSDSEAVLNAVARPENRIFWPAIFGISVALAVQHPSRLAKLIWPPNIISLLAYLAFAGASVLWAFSPVNSFVRFVQQVMIGISIVLPAMLAARTADIMRGLFLCFAFALILNLLFVLDGSATIVSYGSRGLVDIGYQGYFGGKNYLGECAAVALLLSLHEILYRGWRRVLGIIVIVVAILLVFLSDSKTALGLAIICPVLAGLTLIIRKVTRISPAIILLCLPLCYIVLSHVSNFNIYRISYMVYGDSTLTGRSIIWDFADYEIARSPLVGWGYQSFWLLPGSPSIEAPGWIKMMPNAHSGYYDTMLELGYVGLAFLLVFIISTLHAVGRVADRNPARAWLVLSLVLFVIAYNFLESYWMRGFEFLWVVFLIAAAEIARCWQPFPLRRAVYRSKSLRPGSPGASPGARMPRPDMRPS